MALRLAIGATPRHMVVLIMTNIAVVVGAGRLLGLAGLVAIAPSLRTLLSETQPADPLSHAGGLVILLVVAFMADWIPARCAMRIDPATAVWIP